MEFSKGKSRFSVGKFAFIQRYFEFIQEYLAFSEGYFAFSKGFFGFSKGYLDTPSVEKLNWRFSNRISLSIVHSLSGSRMSHVASRGVWNMPQR